MAGLTTRKSVPQFRLPSARRPASNNVGMAEVGSTEHALMVLVILELLALVGIRRVFKAAHGG